MNDGGMRRKNKSISTKDKNRTTVIINTEKIANEDVMRKSFLRLLLTFVYRKSFLRLLLSNRGSYAVLSMKISQLAAFYKSFYCIAEI